MKKNIYFTSAITYWGIIFCFLITPILISVIIETETHLTKRIIYNLISAIGLLIPFILLPKNHKLLIVLYIPIYFIYWLNICHFSIFKAPLLHQSIQIILDSNPQEVYEFIINFGSKFGLYSFLIYACIIFLTYKSLSKLDYTPKFSPKFLIISLCALLFGISKGFHQIQYSRYQYIPYRIAYSGYCYYRDLYNLIQLQKKHLIPQIKGLSSTNSPQTLETYIIVIGESANKEHLGYYGYKRATTPFSSQKISPYIFKNVTSAYTSTMLSLRDTLTFAHKNFTSQGLKQGSLINIFNQANFKSFWISNQHAKGKHDNLISVLAHDSHQINFIRNDANFIGNSQQDSFYDEDLLPFIEKALSDSAKKKIIFVHLAGSHTPYQFRFPKSFDVFQEHNKNSFEKAFDDYDNSILYTDFVLSKIIQMVASRKEQSFVLYFSDHGDDVRLEKDSCHCHTTNPKKQTPPMYEIPFLLWVNSAYQKNNPRLVEQIKSYTERPFITHHLIHSLPTLAGLSFDLQEDDKNLFAPSFVPEKE